MLLWDLISATALGKDYFLSNANYIIKVARLGPNQCY